MAETMTNHYETLGVPKNADKATIKKAYRRKAAKAHPDRPGGSHHQMVALTRAHDTLTDDAKRARYDQTGEDTGLTPLDAMARERVLQVLGQIMEQLPESQDHVAVIVQVLNQGINASREAIAKTKRVQEQARKKAKRFKHRKGERDFIGDFFAQIIGKAADSMAQHEKQIEILKRAVELAKDYDFAAETMSPSGSFYTMAGWPGFK